jgi:hypothetical protein
MKKSAVFGSVIQCSIQIWISTVWYQSGAYLGFCQGGCTLLADQPPPPPDLDPDPDPDPHQDFQLDPDPDSRPCTFLQ